MSVLPQLQTFFQQYFLVVITISFVYKNSKFGEKIFKMAEFIYYLSHISPIFLNVLQSPIYSYFTIYMFKILIKLQQYICCIAYLRNFYIKHVKNYFFFLALPTSTLTMSKVSCIAITLV